MVLDTMEKVCAHLGVPLALEKKEGPSNRITMLGIVIDTVSVFHRRSWIGCCQQ